MDSWQALKQWKTLGPKKKHSILELGLPSTIRLPTIRTGSTASSNIAPVTGQLSIDPATMLGRNQSGSVLLTGLPPLSLTSTDLRASSALTVSVHWDKQGLEVVKELVKEQQKKEREVKMQSEEKSDRRALKESCRSSDGR